MKPMKMARVLEMMPVMLSHQPRNSPMSSHKRPRTDSTQSGPTTKQRGQVDAD